METQDRQDFRKIMRDGPFLPIRLNIYLPHFERLCRVAEREGITPEEVASAIFYQSMRHPDGHHTPGAPENLK